jgi:hypothetical protein
MCVCVPTEAVKGMTSISDCMIILSFGILCGFFLKHIILQAPAQRTIARIKSGEVDCHESPSSNICGLSLVTVITTTRYCTADVRSSSV